MCPPPPSHPAGHPVSIDPSLKMWLAGRLLSVFETNIRPLLFEGIVELVWICTESPTLSVQLSVNAYKWRVLGINSVMSRPSPE
jgi:hypothetical protein